jgi:hypothetical protein
VLAEVGAAVATTERGEHPDGSVRGAWALLSSDACEVFLDSLELELASDADAAPSFHATTARTRGFVEEASPHAARLTFPVTLQPIGTHTAMGSSSQANLTIDARDVDGRIELHVTVVAHALDERPLHFVMTGTFTDDADAIPAKRWDCPY